MNNNSSGKQLVQELLENPTRFYELGKAYELLQEYFAGFSIETLRPLLANKDRVVRRVAVWITSELGKGACGLIDDVIALISDDDRETLYHVLEIIIVCSFAENIHKFVHVVRAMENGDRVIRLHAMRLTSKADVLQLEAASKLLRSTEPSEMLHEKGLSDLLRGDHLDKRQILRMIDDPEPLIRKYGAVAARRFFYRSSELSASAASCTDADICDFLQQDAI